MPEITVKKECCIRRGDWGEMSNKKLLEKFVTLCHEEILQIFENNFARKSKRKSRNFSQATKMFQQRAVELSGREDFPPF